MDHVIAGILTLILILVVIIARQPDNFKVSRSALITAPPEVVFPYVNNLKNWESWSPWAKMDPDAKTTFEGPAEGAGAAMSWDGSKSGAGKMTITESIPGQKVTFRLDFQKPMEATNVANFTFTPEADGTRINWSMSGENSFVGKAIRLVMNCDKMIGGMFEQGLANLKVLAEAKK